MVDYLHNHHWDRLADLKIRAGEKAVCTLYHLLSLMLTAYLDL
jgi:hypothetical protein